MGLASKIKASAPPPQPAQMDSQYASLNYHSSYESLGNYSTSPSAPFQRMDSFGSLSKPVLPPRPKIDMERIRNHLTNIIRLNGLERFYPSQQLQRLLDRISKIDFEALASHWRIGTDLALDFCALGLYDIAVFADDSGSMRFEDNGARIQELARLLARISQITTLFDDDGILVRFFNSTVEGNGIRNASEADLLLNQVSFQGMTPMGTRLEEKILKPFVFEPIHNGTFQKPVLVYVITDGDPSGELPNKIFDAIYQTKVALERSGLGKAVAFEFAQVGRDLAAQQFLTKLDNNHAIGDIIDTTSYFELEAEEYSKKGIELTPEMWTLKLMLGAVDPSYDEQDE